MTKSTKLLLKDLRDKLLKNNKINEKYFNTKFKKDTEFPKDTNIKTLYKDKKELSKFPAFNLDKRNLADEEWLEYKYNKKLSNFYVSNLGRLKYNNEILELVEEYANGGENCVGKLQISKEEKNKKSRDIIKEKYVYQVVARVWLTGKMDKGWIVHHIDNDSYNNNIENLILLQQCQHNFLHKNNNDKCEAYPQEYYKEGNIAE